MDVGGDPRRALSAEGLSILREGIFLVLSCWWGLQMALQNYSMAVHKLGYDIVSWFTLSKGPPYIDDLEVILDEHFLKSLITYVEDGEMLVLL
uniref:Uncharacterized protein n=1 Tax=Quercus lobata TaxID=97700 RepID=A0A7N2L5S9_QUELO